MEDPQPHGEARLNSAKASVLSAHLFDHSDTGRTVENPVAVAAGQDCFFAGDSFSHVRLVNKGTPRPVGESGY